MVRHCRTVDCLQCQLGQRVGIFEILVTEVLHGPRRLAVGLDNMLRNRRGDIQRKVPGHRHQQVVDPQHRVLQAVLGRLLWVIDFLRYATTADTVPTPHVDHTGLVIGDHGHVMHLALPFALGVLVGSYPAALPGPQRVIQAQRILAFFRPTVWHVDRPAVDLEAAGHHAVVTAGRDDVGTLRRQWYLILWLKKRL